MFCLIATFTEYRSVIPLLIWQVRVGKEKEAVAEMLPYLRLGYVSDPADMHSVITSQGPVCPVSSLSCYDVLMLVSVAASSF